MTRLGMRDHAIKTQCGRIMQRSSNSVRIIGGKWRRRLIHFSTKSSVRPTPDRVRETLFNWLQLACPGARCLDLFCGSGALGLEALSRGASQAVFVDMDMVCVDYIKQAAMALNAGDTVICKHGKVQTIVPTLVGTFDVVFIDPPYDAHLIDDILSLLGQHTLTHADTMVYVEQASTDDWVCPPGWYVHRACVYSGVHAQLLKQVVA